MAGTLRYVSKVDTDNAIDVTIEYNTNDAVPVVWQETSSFHRDRFAGFTSAAQFHAEVVIPDAAVKIKGMRALVVARNAVQTAITAATVYTVDGT